MTTDHSHPAVAVTLLGLVRWAAGGEGSLPEVPCSWTIRACNHLEGHGLLGRYLDRHANEPPSWDDAELVAQVSRRHSEVLDLIARQVAAIHEVCAATGDKDHLVVLKGMSTYQLTGSARCARTGDVDVVAPPALDLPQVLLSLGYVQTRDAFLHEIGEFTKGEIEIDLHSHFPVYAYPQDLAGVNLRPEANLGRWNQRARFQERRITLDYFLATARNGAAPGGSGVRVAGPELLAIILASHAFMNFTNVWSISHREKPYVRLGELTDIQDLLALPTFNHDLFGQLIGELGATDAMRWATSTCQALLGRASMEAARHGIPTSTVRCLWWDLWADVPVPTQQMVASNWLEMSSLVGDLGANVVETNKWFATAGLDPKHTLTRVLATSPVATDFAVQLDPDSGPPSILIKLNLPAAAHDFRIRVDFGNWAVEWKRSCANGAETIVGASTTATWRGGQHAGTLQIETPTARAGVGFPPMLIGVVTTSAGNDAVEATLVPLRVRSHR